MHERVLRRGECVSVRLCVVGYWGACGGVLAANTLSYVTNSAHAHMPIPTCHTVLVRTHNFPLF